MTAGDLMDGTDACPRCARIERRHARERRARLESDAIAERFTRQALHDPLTGLGNRILFLDQLETSLKRARETGGTIGVLFLDLDDFKQVNDTLGHSAGDRLLAEIGRRLTECVRAEDVAARLGGDEFVVLIEDVPDADLLVRAARRIGEQLVRPVEIGGQVWRTRTSIGLKLATGEDTPESVLRDADAAMYAAKHGGKGRIELFRPSTHTRLVERLEMETALRHAIDTDAIEPWFQPIVDLRRREVVAVEALARWHNGPDGPVAPGVFVELAHEIGVLDALSSRILEAACAQTVAWGPDAGWVTHVNLHPGELTDPTLPLRVADVLRRTGLAGPNLCLEITEQAIVEDGIESMTVLRALTDLGVRLAIDDFGAAYSSFGYLRRLPVDLIKVDRSLTAGVGSDSKDEAILAAVVTVADALDIDLVAEGVETIQQAQGLARVGVELVQGWLFAPAVPASQWHDVTRTLDADLAVTQYGDLRVP